MQHVNRYETIKALRKELLPYEEKVKRGEKLSDQELKDMGDLQVKMYKTVNGYAV